MTKLSRWLGAFVFTTVAGWTSWAAAQNQTTTLTPVIPGNYLPFNVQIQTALVLPSGLQSFVVGTYRGKWLLLAGRINGLHGFGGSGNFPADTQNTTIFVIDPREGTVSTRLLTDSASGLTQAQVDLLSVTGAQFFQSGSTLYMCGGYGFDTATSDFTTKLVLTAIDIPGLMHWVTSSKRGETAAEYINSVFDPIFQVSGGAMVQPSAKHARLIFGEDFEGSVSASSTGTYSGQIRNFTLKGNLKHLGFTIQPSLPAAPDSDFERTDLTVVPTIIHDAHARASLVQEGFTAFSGVFTPGFGVWTVPVEISPTGVPTMADPTQATTFKQGMNNFACPALELFSLRENASYTVLMGGISYGFFQNTTFETDAELPFINQVTAVRRDGNGVYSQYLADGAYPVIPSTGSNPGNPLLFGAGATFIPATGLRTYSNGVIKLDDLGTRPLMVGYIVGGIQSTLPNTNTTSDSSASPYIFTVTLTRKP